MGKVKEKLAAEQYEPRQELEQEIGAGASVLVYDSKFGAKPVLATVLLVQNQGQDRILSVELEPSKTVMQVYDIQCRLAEKKAARRVYVLIQDDTGELKDVAFEVPEQGTEGATWVSFSEVLKGEQS